MGGAQTETAGEKADAIARGKATACVIGPQCIGTRFNVLMTIQVPLQQQDTPARGGFGDGMFGGIPPPGMFGSGGGMGGGMGASGGAFGGAGCFGAPPAAPSGCVCFGAASAPAAFSFGAPQPMARSAARSGGAPMPQTGTANAARVSYGSEHDTWAGLPGRAKTPTRHSSEHCTITLVLYNVVAGGVPSEADVAAAIDDLEQLYAACAADARANVGFANASTSPAAPFVPPPPPANPFLPPPPKPPAVIGGDTFPQPAPPPLPFGTPAVKPSSDVPEAILRAPVPKSNEGYLYVHELANRRLTSPSATHAELGEAFALFRYANEIHTQVAGVPSPSALYNLACCCSRSAALGQRVLGADFLSWSAEQCLDMASVWLRAAVASGFHDFAHVQVDPDLQAVRTARAAKFATAVQMAQALATGV